ncbi:conserved hypothetical protein [Magnetococcus marinus MC-1]|uniref:Uncharacterized protein n=1 Tax=Magnetococcus marinus (strain ATCC BAA-1437 / JCM 17883 / MC-1) TaxID=156889 RepID=A0L548_MAGMM|nr:hypothetical protein [Magnetococcus marinus]ABK43091.1 conserved hypothetical protein [Magnetococcus marinus MC-1]
MTVPNQEWMEGELYFDFSQALSVISLDGHGQGHGMSHLMKAVDFVVEWEQELWLIEIKDPEKSTIPKQHRVAQLESFHQKLSSQSLLHAELFPKLIDSLIYLGLNQGISKKPMRYLTLIGMSSLQPPFLTVLKDALLNLHGGCLLGRPTKGWEKGFDVHLFNLELWNEWFPHCPASRIEK